MNYESTVHITNSSDKMLCFLLEPWGQPIEMMPGATFVVVAEAECNGSFEVNYDESTITLWAWPTATVKIFFDEDEIAQGLPPVPGVPDGQSVSSFLGVILGRKKLRKT